MNPTLNLRLAFGLLVASLPAVCAQTKSADFTTEPDKTLAAAHESFVKHDTQEAAEQIHKAGTYVKKEADKVASGSKEEMKKAGAELDKLGDGVKAGRVKSDAELKQTFAKVDHQIADCWHKTAADAKRSGKDSGADLKKAGDALAGAAKWSGTQLKEGAKSSIDAMKKAGKGVGTAAKASADEVDGWFKHIGEGIDDLGHKL
jgi:hypothetical protein